MNELEALRARIVTTRDAAKATGRGWRQYAAALDAVIAELDALAQPLRGTLQPQVEAAVGEQPSEAKAVITDAMVTAAATVLFRPHTDLRAAAREALEAALAARSS